MIETDDGKHRHRNIGHLYYPPASLLIALCSFFRELSKRGSATELPIVTMGNVWLSALLLREKISPKHAEIINAELFDFVFRKFVLNRKFRFPLSATSPSNQTFCFFRNKIIKFDQSWEIS